MNEHDFISVMPGMIKAALLTTAEENSRYAVNALLLVTDQTGAKLVSTDGRRISIVQVDFVQHRAAKLVMDRAATDRMLSAFFNPGDTPGRQRPGKNTGMRFLIAGNHVQVWEESRGVRVSDIPEAMADKEPLKFPEYAGILKDHTAAPFCMDLRCASLTAAADATAAIAAKNIPSALSFGVPATPKPVDMDILISSVFTEKGEDQLLGYVVAGCNVKIKRGPAEAFHVAVNSRFVRDAAKAVALLLPNQKDPRVEFYATAPNRPVIFRHESGFYFSMIMPVNPQ